MIRKHPAPKVSIDESSVFIHCIALGSLNAGRQGFRTTALTQFGMSPRSVPRKLLSDPAKFERMAVKLGFGTKAEKIRQFDSSPLEAQCATITLSIESHHSLVQYPLRPANALFARIQSFRDLNIDLLGASRCDRHPAHRRKLVPVYSFTSQVSNRGGSNCCRRMQSHGG